jgi:hypothetical protein
MMKTLVYALSGLAIAATAAQAQQIAPSTITGYAASVAVARGVPLDGSANAGLDRRAPQFRQASADVAPARPAAIVTTASRRAVDRR